MYDFDKIGNELSQLRKSTAIEFLQSKVPSADMLDISSLLVGAPIQASAEAFIEFVRDEKNGPDDFLEHVRFFVDDNRGGWGK